MKSGLITEKGLMLKRAQLLGTSNPDTGFNSPGSPMRRPSEASDAIKRKPSPGSGFICVHLPSFIVPSPRNLLPPPPLFPSFLPSLSLRFL